MEFTFSMSKTLPLQSEEDGVYLQHVKNTAIAV